MGKSFSQYNESVDFLKGILITLVVIGHVIADSIPRYIIYSFHLPLFFFLSGYLIKYNDFGKEFAKKAKRLIVPYLTASLIYFLWKGGYNGEVKDLFRFIVFPYLHLWFIYSLFLHYLFIYFLSRTKNWTMWLIMGFIFFLLSFWLQQFYLAPVLRFFAFTLFGFVYRNSLVSYFQKLTENVKLLFLFSSIIGLLYIILASSKPIFPALGIASYGILLFLLFFIQNSILSLGVGALINVYNNFKLSWINLMGQKSLVIYLYHMLFILEAKKIMEQNFYLILIGIIMPLLVDFCLKRFTLYRFLVLGK